MREKLVELSEIYSVTPKGELRVSFVVKRQSSTGSTIQFEEKVKQNAFEKALGCFVQIRLKRSG